MDSLKKQRIESSSITCVSKRVDSVSFDGGIAPKDGVKKSDGEFNVRNDITNAFSDENGVRFRQLNLVIELLPSDEGHYYRAKISVSGIYRAPFDLDDETFDREALSFGMQDLYSYARGIIENVAAGGVWGPLYLPQISFTI